MNTLDVYIDFKSPASWLAIGPTRAMSTELDIGLRWLPFDSRQYALAEEKPGETRRETHFRIREYERRRVHLHYASVRGVEMSFPSSPGSTRRALAAMLALGKECDAFLDAAFLAYWRDHADLDDEGVVDDLLKECGVTNLTISMSALDRALDEADQRDVIDAPTYLLGEERFLGREHLPLLRERLLRA